MKRSGDEQQKAQALENEIKSLHFKVSVRVSVLVALAYGLVQTLCRKGLLNIIYGICKRLSTWL